MAKKQFEFNGEEIKVSNLPGAADLPGIPTGPDINLTPPSFTPGVGTNNNSSSQDILDNLYNNSSTKISSVGLNQLNYSDRYKSAFIGADAEEMHAQSQTTLNKATHGFLKGVNLVGTTILGGVGVLYGGVKSMTDGKLSSIFDNEIMQGLDRWNNKVDQEYLPNYYTQRETQAEWYETDNWLRANFLWDKVIKNAGYAVGAMVSGNVFSGVSAAAGTALGRLASVGATAAEASTAFKLFTPILKNTARAFSAGKNIEASEILASRINSLSDITNKASLLEQAAKQTNTFAKINDYGRRAAIAAYSSAGEASFEALQTSNSFRNKLIDDYFNEHGAMPKGDELEKINEYSNQVGKTSFFGNLAILSVTEYVQLPYLLGSNYKTTRKAINKMYGEVDDIALSEGKYIAADKLNAPTSRFGKLYKPTAKIGKDLASFKSTMLFDPKEGLQETLQYALQVGTEHYFNEAYKGHEAEDFIDAASDVIGFGLLGRNEKGEGVGALVSKEGIEGGIIGGLTGGPMQAMQMHKDKKQRASTTKQFIEQLNSAPTFKEAFIDRINSANRAVVLQQKQESAIKSGDKLEALDIKTDLMHNYLAPRIKYGRMDLIMSDLEDMNQMTLTPEGLATLKEQGIGNVDDTALSLQKRINEIKDNATSISNLYEYAITTFGSQMQEVDGKQFKKYSNVVLDKMVYAGSKILDYNKRIEELTHDIVSTGIAGIDEAVTLAMSGDDSKINEILGNIQNSNSLTKEETSNQLLDLVELHKRREVFNKEFNDIKANPAKYSTPIAKFEKANQTTTEDPTSDEDTIAKETIDLTTKTGKSKVEIGTEYFLGVVMDKTKRGDVIYRSPVVTIVGKNEDGTLNIKTQDGQEFEVNESIFKKYSLEKVSDIKNDGRKSFFMKNWNRQFINKQIKVNNRPAVGRIEYSAKPGMFIFKYINEKGVVKSVLLSDKALTAQGEYKSAMVEPLNKSDMKASEIQEFEEIFSLSQTPAALKERMMAYRLEYFSGLYNDTVKSLEEISDKLQKSKDTLEKVHTTLVEKQTTTKDGLPLKKVTPPIRRAINELIKQQEILTSEIASMEQQIEELNDNVKTYSDVINTLLDSKEEDNSEVIKKLRKDVSDIQDLVNKTEKELNIAQALLKKITNSLKEAMKYLKHFIAEMRRKDPNLPLSIEEYATQLERFYGEDGAKEIINNKLGFTQAILGFDQAVQDFADEEGISKLEEDKAQLSASIKDISEDLNDLLKERDARRKVLDTFEAFAEAEASKITNQTLLNSSTKLKRNLFSTKDTQSTQTGDTTGVTSESSKKQTNIVPISTINAGDKPHIQRANKFGVNLETMPNRKNIKGVIITKKLEEQIGLPGLMEHLASTKEGALDTSIDQDTTIAMVMVEQDPKTKELSLINENGEKITLGNPLDQAIYQVYPTEKLEWSNQYGKESMFRKGTSEETIKQIKAKYAEWRTAVLSLEEPSEIVAVEASFGNIQYDAYTDEDGNIKKNYRARNSVSSAGLITEEQLNNKNINVLFIPKNDKAAVKGTTHHNNVLGVPFLSMPNGYVKLDNRQLTEQEADVVFKTIVAFCNSVFTEGPSGRYLKFLKSTVFWGIARDQKDNAKPATNNSIFFTTEEDGSIVLKIGKDKTYNFTPFALEENKELILEDIKSLFMHVNSYYAKQLEEKYEQIIDIKENGDIVSIIWDNYQQYLLSEKNPDGSKRTNIPLTTNARQLESKDDINREGIYFYASDRIGEYEVMEPLKTKTKQVAKPKANAKPAVTKKPSLAGNYINKAKAILKEQLPGFKDKQHLVDKYTKVTNALIETLKQAKEILVVPNFKVGTEYINAYTTSFGTEVFFRVLTNDTITQENVNEVIEFIPSLELDLSIMEAKRIIGTKQNIKPTEVSTDLALQAIRIGLSKKLVFSDASTSTGKVNTGISKEERLQKSLETIDNIDNVFEAKYIKPGWDTSMTRQVQTLQFEELIVGKTRAEVEKAIRDKFNAEVASTPVDDQYEPYNAFGDEEYPEGYSQDNSTPTYTGPQIDNTVQAALAKFRANKGNNREILRRVVNEVTSAKIESWPEIEQWLKDNVPGISVNRVKNIIRTSNGGLAWGMFKAGAVYVYQNAEAGTTYHEVFHAVWRMFTDATEQNNVISEIKSRKGSFKDVITGEEVEYSKASNLQIEELLAEEFRNYVQDSKIPSKPAKGVAYVIKMFVDLANFIKKLFMSNKTLDLFEKINTGKLRQDTLTNSIANKILDVEEVGDVEDALFRLKDSEKNDIIQEMVYSTIYKFIDENKDLFAFNDAFNKQELLAELKEHVTMLLAGKLNDYMSVRELAPQEQKVLFDPFIIDYTNKIKDLDSDWDNISRRFEEAVKAYGIEFDENDDVQINDEDKIKESDKYDSTKIDTFKKASPAVKLLLATLPMYKNDGTPVETSIGGLKMKPLGETFSKLMNKLHTANSIEEMMERLKELAVNDKSFEFLYKRVTKSTINSPEVINYNAMKDFHNVRVLDSFWKIFKKMNPEVKNIYIFSNGEVAVGEANLATAAQQFKYEFGSNIVGSIKSDGNLFSYDERKKAYIANTNRLKNISVSTPLSALNFLKRMNVDFSMEDYNKLNSDNQKQFVLEIIQGIKNSLQEITEIKTINPKTLNIEKRLFQLASLKVGITNPEAASTYFNIGGEKTQTYIGVNPAGNLYNTLNSIDSLSEESLKDSGFEYLLTDTFSEGSNLLERKFDEKGNLKSSGKDLFKIGYVGGTSNEARGTQKASAKLTFKERILQEFNLNLEGWYTNLIPGDASLEWMLYMGNPISIESLERGFSDVHDIFKKYFISEINTSRDERVIAKVSGRKSSDLRFFKDILPEEVHTDIVADKDLSAEELYTKYESKIKKATEDYIKKNSNDFYTVLRQYNVFKYDETSKVSVENTNLTNLTDDQLQNHFLAVTVNYMIANIEMHKLLYSDPYQYSDELKRIKSFTSPRQSIMHNSREINNVYDRIFNKGIDKKDIAYTNFGVEYFRTVSYDDIEGAIPEIEGYENYTETDGGGIISLKAHRHLKIRAAEWTDAEEAQFQFDMEFERKIKSGNLKTTEDIKKFLKTNPKVKSTYTPNKPIVAGNSANEEDFNDVVLDKFALYPLSFRVLYELNPNSNAIALYNKMQTENIDYMVFKSGRKVSKAHTIKLYNDKGNLNSEPYTDDQIVRVPFNVLSIQSEVPSKDTPKVTRGSQVTKLLTMDLMEAGVPVDFMPEERDLAKRIKQWEALENKFDYAENNLYTEIKKNQRLLEELTDIGYNNLLNSLGIISKDGKFVIEDFSKAAKTLRNEIFKREVNDNISEALNSFLNGKAVLEATPAYQQIRNILYSIADKEFISPKVSGGLKVQIPSTLLESVRAEAKVINNKEVYTSEVLGFYKNEDGKRVCEIMLGRWFESPLSDEEILSRMYTKEGELTSYGKDLLGGIGFRIPTQKQNSIDAFVIKQFLPKEFGDSVVVPAALVNKVGSDFDIDKLSVYLKNVYLDKDNVPTVIPFFGIGTEAREKIKQLVLSTNLAKQAKQATSILKNKNLLDTLGAAVDSESSDNFRSKWLNIFSEIFPQAIEDNILDIGKIEAILLNRINKAGKTLDKLTEQEIDGALVDQISDEWYKKSVENAYIKSSENLVSSPYNYERMMMPNSAEQLKKLSKDIASVVYGEAFDYTKVGNMLSKSFMARLRHAFVSGKYAIGIAATAQTNHALNQRQLITIDPARLSLLSEQDRFWVSGGVIKFKNANKVVDSNTGKTLVHLSGITNGERSEKFPNGQDISDLIGQFIDGYVDISKGPWIMELGATPNVASTWLFLIKAGVPIADIAYFMNQPLIRQYLKTIENAGYSYLFIDSFLEEFEYDMMMRTGMNYEQYMQESADFNIPSLSSLKKSLGKDIADMNNIEFAEQMLMLKEFTKYAKLAEQLFHVTQGSNFDTASFNDNYLVFKKYKQLEKARNTLISSVDTLVSNSFIAKLANRINNTRDALAEILIADRGPVREVVQKVLEPFVDKNNKDFVKISQKVVTDMFDWVVQNKYNSGVLQKAIKDIMYTNGGTATAFMKFALSVKNNIYHPLHDNLIFKTMDFISPDQTGVVKPFNLKIKNKENKSYDQNNMIYAFKEIKQYFLDNPKEENLYKQLVTLSILQSGLSNSPISFTSLLPQEDIANIYNDTLLKIATLSDLDTYYSLGVFYKNNWNNSDFVPHIQANTIKYDSMNGVTSKYNPAMAFLAEDIRKAVDEGKVPTLLSQSIKNKSTNSDYIVYSWEKGVEMLTPNDKKRANNVIEALKLKKKEMRARGDYSYIQKGLFRKVYDKFGNPLETIYTNQKGRITRSHIYKLVNAWGDSYKLNEFYATEKPSVFDNGFNKTTNTATDGNIVELFIKSPKTTLVNDFNLFEKNSVSLQAKNQEDNSWETEDNNDTCVPF